jgi:hypothetical protein
MFVELTLPTEERILRLKNHGGLWLEGHTTSPRHGRLGRLITFLYASTGPKPSWRTVRKTSSWSYPLSVQRTKPGRCDKEIKIEPGYVHHPGSAKTPEEEQSC